MNLRPDADPRAQRAIEWVAKQGAALGRKFELDDVEDDPPLQVAAEMYADAYAGTFDFMLEMNKAFNRYGALTAKQARSVLNCIVADVRRSAQPMPQHGASSDAPAVPNIREVHRGRYRIVLDPRATAVVRIDAATWATDKPEGTRAISVRVGMAWQFCGFVSPDGQVCLSRKAEPHAASIARALAILVQGVRDGSWLIHALAYSVDCRECCFCGQELDTEESLSAGYGPSCAKRHGLPWGAKVTPAAVQLARAAAQPTPRKERQTEPEPTYAF